VLPEDSATSQLANGFVNHVSVIIRAVQVLPYVGGWENVIGQFKRYHLQKMSEFPERRIVLLMDFDGNPEGRLAYVKNEIPEDIKDRVFLLGVYSEPEKLRNAVGKKFEAIGEALAEECAENKKTFWMHELLKHNEPELNRLFENVRPHLFRP
jgi:hypothetical protein